MTEIRFFHLEQRAPALALPALVQEAYAQRLKIIIEAPDDNLLNNLDESLWTFDEESFLPHAIGNDDMQSRQPILLTKENYNSNGAEVRFLLGGANARSSLVASPTPYAQIVILFNGSDEQEVAAARAQWTELKAAGRTISYWRQDATGVWGKMQ
jgi:DNA polymerase III subunit chi